MTFKSVAEFLDPEQGHRPTAAERQLIEDTQAGQPCYLCDRDNPSRPATASDATRIRAALLRLLVTGGTKDCGFHERGVSLTGGWIEGKLDLSYCKAKGQTVLEYCRFPDKPNLQGAHIQRLSLARSVFPGLDARNLHVDSDVSLQGSASTATIDVSFASIGAQYDSRWAKLSGIVSKTGTRATALLAEGLQLGSDLLLNHSSCLGTADLTHAQISGQLDCTGASFDIGTTPTAYDPKSPSGDNDDDFHAISARRLHVERGFLFRQVTVRGHVMLHGAHIGDLLDDGESWPRDPSRHFLAGFTYNRFGVSANWDELSRFDWLVRGTRDQPHYAQPYTQLARVLRQMGHAGKAQKVLMEAALVEAKAFQKQHRARRRFVRSVRRSSRNPSEGAGLAPIDTLGELPQSLQVEAKETLDLLNRYHRPFPSPSNAPPPPDPLTLAYARQDFRNRLWWRAADSRMAIVGSRIKHGFLSLIVGHGHAPHRAILAILASTVLAAFWYGHAWKEGAMVPNSDVILTSFNWWWAMQDQTLAPTAGWAATGTAMHYETFYSLAYALDAIVPLVDLGQTSAWSATTVTWTGWSTRVLTMVLEVWGWVATALGAAAVTGLVQRNEPN